MWPHYNWNVGFTNGFVESTLSVIDSMFFLDFILTERTITLRKWLFTTARTNRSSVGHWTGSTPGSTRGAKMATYSSQIFRCFYTVLVIYCLLLDTAKYVSGQNVLCPEECWCLGSLVDCSKRHLTSIPTDLPTWVTMLWVYLHIISSQFILSPRCLRITSPLSPVGLHHTYYMAHSPWHKHSHSTDRSFVNSKRIKNIN